MIREPFVVRLSSAESDAAPELQALLRSARAEQPTDDALHRMAHGLGLVAGATLPPPAANVAAPAALGTKAAAGLAGKVWLWMALGAVAIGAVVVSRQLATAPPDRAPRAPAGEISPEISAETSAPPSHDDSPAPAPAAAATTARPDSAIATIPRQRPRPTRRGSNARRPAESEPAAAPVEPRVVSESQLLARAHAALRDGDPARARRWTDEHRAAYPGGVLAEERDAIAIESFARLGDVDRANRLFDRFSTEFPRSSYRRKLERILRTR